jgi:hypothetical protein
MRVDRLRDIPDLNSEKQTKAAIGISIVVASPCFIDRFSDGIRYYGSRL